MKTEPDKPTHVTYGNVLDDLGFSPEHATALKFKAELYQAILKFAKKYSQKQLQIILAEPQPRISELLNGKIANKSVDKLLHYAGRLGVEAKAKFTQPHNPQSTKNSPSPIRESDHAQDREAARPMPKHCTDDSGGGPRWLRQLGTVRPSFEDIRELRVSHPA